MASTKTFTSLIAGAARISALSLRNTSTTTIRLPLAALRPFNQHIHQPIRFRHSIPQPPNSSSPTPTSTDKTATKPTNGTPEEVATAPHYELTFTCVPCNTRSQHKITKQGYHHGSVLISCPGCRNKHVISDHLKIFGDRNLTVEDLMRERGQLVKKGTLGPEGDLEFWEDGTETSREERIKEEDVKKYTRPDDAAPDDAVPGSTFR